MLSFDSCSKLLSGLLELLLGGGGLRIGVEAG